MFKDKKQETRNDKSDIPEQRWKNFANGTIEALTVYKWYIDRSIIHTHSEGRKYYEPAPNISKCHTDSEEASDESRVIARPFSA